MTGAIRCRYKSVGGVQQTSATRSALQTSGLGGDGPHHRDQEKVHQSGKVTYQCRQAKRSCAPLRQGPCLGAQMLLKSLLDYEKDHGSRR